jgi:hypothetical protein
MSTQQNNGIQAMFIARPPPCTAVGHIDPLVAHVSKVKKDNPLLFCKKFGVGRSMETSVDSDGNAVASFETKGQRAPFLSSYARKYSDDECGANKNVDWYFKLRHADFTG